MATASIDWATLRSVAQMSDPIGVLSIYLTLDPQSRADPTAKPASEVRLRHELAGVREAARHDRPREHGKAVEARLDELRIELDRLRDPAATGQGRALFAGVASGEVRTLSLQVPLVDRVVLEPYAYLRPLLVAWSTAGPAGVVAVSAEQVRVVDLRFGLTELVGTIPYQGAVEQRELKGPAPGNPAMAQHSSSQHDLFARREDDKLARFLRTVSPRLAELAKQWEWGYLVLTGDATLVQALREGLPPALTAEVVTLDHPVNSMPEPKLAATVTPALTQARRRNHHRLAERAQGNALSANTGAYGLGETLGALQQGRVAHLLLDADRQWSGRRSPEGVLAPESEVPPGTDPDALVPEPHLAERMIELAFRDSAEVTMLDPDAAAPLADADGIGAILRW